MGADGLPFLAAAPAASKAVSVFVGNPGVFSGAFRRA